MVDGEGDWI